MCYLALFMPYKLYIFKAGWISLGTSNIFSENSILKKFKYE